MAFSGRLFWIKPTSYLVGGWATPLKNMKVNWDDDIPNIWENKTDVPNHQPDIDEQITTGSCEIHPTNRIKLLSSYSFDPYSSISPSPSF